MFHLWSYEYCLHIHQSTLCICFVLKGKWEAQNRECLIARLDVCHLSWYKFLIIFLNGDELLCFPVFNTLPTHWIFLSTKKFSSVLIRGMVEPWFDYCALLLQQHPFLATCCWPVTIRLSQLYIWMQGFYCFLMWRHFYISFRCICLVLSLYPF